MIYGIGFLIVCALTPTPIAIALFVAFLLVWGFLSYEMKTGENT